MDVEVLLNGVSAASLSLIGDLSWTENADGGSDTASWSMPDLSSFAVHPATRRGTLTQLRFAGDILWSGILAEPDRAALTFTASGLSKQAANTAALNAAGNDTSSNPHEVVTAAISRGRLLGWNYRGQLPNLATAASANTAAPNTVSALLDATATAYGYRWGVDGRGEFFFRPDSTNPAWSMTPASVVMGVADDQYVTDIYARFLQTAAYYDGKTNHPDAYGLAHAASAVSQVAASRWGAVESIRDLTSLGVITATAAANEGQSELTRDGARMGFTSGFTGTALTLATLTGGDIDTRLVHQGDVIRLHGVLNADGNLNLAGYQDVVVGSIQHTAATQDVAITPVGLVARSFGDVIAQTVTSDDEFLG